MTNSSNLPDKRWVARSFGDAAQRYDGLATLQREVGGELLRDLELLAWVPRRVVDLGAGTGRFLPALRGSIPDAALLAVDLAEGMLIQARQNCATLPDLGFVCGDAEALPLASCSQDLIFSNLSLQWCRSLPQALLELKRVLANKGTLLFSTFTEGTLQELKSAWAMVDDFHHVNHFHDEGWIAECLRGAGFAHIGMRKERKVTAYVSVVELMRELKGLGAHNVTAGRPRHLVGKGTLQRMMESYPGVTATGPVLATFEIAYVRAEV